MVNVHGARFRSRSAPPFDEIAAAWLAVTGESIAHGEPLWCNAFGNQSRHATLYRRGRVLLAGDAAHRQMPIGGLALNTGLGDAFELSGPLVDAVITGKYEPLDHYQAQRHPAVEQILAVIRAQSTLLLGGAEMGPVREMLSELMAIPGVTRRLGELVGVIGSTR